MQIAQTPYIQGTIWKKKKIVGVCLDGGQSSYTDIDESVVILKLNFWTSRREAITTIFKVFGMIQPQESNEEHSIYRRRLFLSIIW